MPEEIVATSLLAKLRRKENYIFTGTSHLKHTPMKSTLSSLRHTTLVSLLLLISFSSLHAQQSKKEKEAAEATAAKDLLLSKSYVFEAQSTVPSGGKIKQLSYGYYMKVTGDTLISYLPYFGQAHAPTYSSDNGGINFTSTKFDYKVEDRKKGGWDIIIVPDDYSDVQKLYLTVFENASATLQVISQSRSPISYSGYVTAPKKK